MIPNSPNQNKQKTYWLIDLENTGQRWTYIKSHVKPNDIIVFFWSDKTGPLHMSRTTGLNWTQFMFIQCDNGSPNAMDFQLSAWLGLMAGLHQDAEFIIVSDDRGYSPLVPFMRRLDLNVCLLQLGTVQSEPEDPGLTSDEPANSPAKAPQAYDRWRTYDDQPIQKPEYANTIPDGYCDTQLIPKNDPLYDPERPPGFPVIQNGDTSCDYDLIAERLIPSVEEPFDCYIYPVNLPKADPEPEYISPKQNTYGAPDNSDQNEPVTKPASTVRQIYMQKLKALDILDADSLRIMTAILLQSMKLPQNMRKLDTRNRLMARYGAKDGNNRYNQARPVILDIAANGPWPDPDTVTPSLSNDAVNKALGQGGIPMRAGLVAKSVMAIEQARRAGTETARLLSLHQSITKIFPPHEQSKALNALHKFLEN